MHIQQIKKHEAHGRKFHSHALLQENEAGDKTRYQSAGAG